VRVCDDHERILGAVAGIPRGRVATYGAVAERAGLPRRWRLVGRILRGLPDHSGAPWHRVVNARGEISLRDGDSPELQRLLLEDEGVVFDVRGRIDLKTYGWEG
jgi:methylated-DNA-protein-cysteine methyltransferase-like protein